MLGANRCGSAVTLAVSQPSTLPLTLMGTTTWATAPLPCDRCSSYWAAPAGSMYWMTSWSGSDSGTAVPVTAASNAASKPWQATMRARLWSQSANATRARSAPMTSSVARARLLAIVSVSAMSASAPARVSRALARAASWRVSSIAVAESRAVAAKRA